MWIRRCVGCDDVLFSASASSDAISRVTRESELPMSVVLCLSLCSGCDTIFRTRDVVLDSPLMHTIAVAFFRWSITYLPAGVCTFEMHRFHAWGCMKIYLTPTLGDIVRVVTVSPGSSVQAGEDRRPGGRSFLCYARFVRRSTSTVLHRRPCVTVYFARFEHLS
ncbi:hypothetical protein EV363DRAFT_1219421, partial [Boletus edulis]